MIAMHVLAFGKGVSSLPAGAGIALVGGIIMAFLTRNKK